MLSPTKVDDKVNGVLFYSPSTVESYLQENDTIDKIAFCIGETTAKEASKYFTEVKTAKMPTAESMLELVKESFIISE